MATLDAYTPQNVGPVPPWVSLRVLRQAYAENPEAFSSTELETYKALADYYGVPFDIQTSARRAVGNFLFNLADAALLGLLPDSIRDNLIGKPLTGAERFAAGLGDVAGLLGGVGTVRMGLRLARAKMLPELRKLVAKGERLKEAQQTARAAQEGLALSQEAAGFLGRFPEVAATAGGAALRGAELLASAPNAVKWTIAGLLGMMQPFEGPEY